MSVDNLAEWLQAVWSEVLEGDYGEPDPAVDRFVDHRVTSIRYAVITQMLAKIVNPKRDVVRLTSELTPEDTAPRTIASGVVAPFSRENDNVLGSSPDPYVNNPLRRESLRSDDSTIRSSDRQEWRSLGKFLEEFSDADQQTLRHHFLRVLRSIARRRDRQKIAYPIPERVSSVEIARAMHEFLSAPSGGLRPLIVTAALMRTVGSAFSLFSRVESQGLNEADSARNRPGDVMCFARTNNGGDEKIRLVLEVKDMAITLQHVDHAIEKIRSSGANVSELLFAAPGISEVDESAIHERFDAVWRTGVDINRIDILTLVRAIAAVFANAERVRFLAEIGNELDERAEHAHRDAWRRVLQGFSG